MFVSQWEVKLVKKHGSGFTLFELMVVILIFAVVAAFALPQALNAIKDYRLNADGTSIASMLNVARMQAASQFAPYRVVINVAAGTYWEEQLCGNTPASVDPNCTSPYNPYSTPRIVGGTQYISQGDSFSSCRPTAISAYPGEIQADPNPCPDPLYIYFNTRGSPVSSTGNPVSNGGYVLYITNSAQMTEAVTVAVGGAVSTWLWNSVSGNWSGS
jgi:prepilin-type N-terminal cleavage/methylation domain-containing protein